MKKSINDKLQKSIDNERIDIKKRDIGKLDTRFQKADDLFNNQNIIIPNKIKVIKDTFTFPTKDYDLIENCKSRLLDNKILSNKSEIVRAGLIALSKLDDQKLIDIIKMVEKIKTGRKKN